MRSRLKTLSWLLTLLLLAGAADDALAGNDRKKKKKKKKQEAEATETTETAEGEKKTDKKNDKPSQEAGPPRVVRDVDKRLLAFDTSTARSLLAEESIESNVHLQIADGRVLEQEGEYGRAAGRLAAAADRATSDPAPLIYLGETHLRTKNTGSANDAFARAEQRARALLEDDPDDPQALYYLGVAQQRQRKFPEAIATLEKASAASPRDAMIAYQLGVTHAFQREWNAAIDLLTRAIDLDSGIAYAYYYRGLSAGEAGRKDLLVNDLDRFLTMAPNAPEAEQARRLMSGL